MADLDHTVLPTGTRVVDLNGAAIGRIRSVYPHFIAVDAEGMPPRAYRVPPHTAASYDGNTLKLSVPVEALDEMTPPSGATEELPRHGGPPPQD